MKRINEKINDIKVKSFENIYLFSKDIDDIFILFYEKLEEIKNQIFSIETNTKNVNEKYILIIDALKNLRYFVFKFCCDFNNKEQFDIAFCSYRLFLQEYAVVNTNLDDLLIQCLDGEIATITTKIKQERKMLKPITNNNLTEHNENHKYNEQYYKKIEKLEDERRRLLLC